MGNVSMKPENTSDVPEERSEAGQELQELQPGRLSQSAQLNTVPSMPLKSALKKNKPWFMVRDHVEKKEVRFNLADLEMRDEDEDPMSPPAPGYGVKFLETEVWPGRDVDQVEVDDDAPVLPDAANSPDTTNTPGAANFPDTTNTPGAANSPRAPIQSPRTEPSMKELGFVLLDIFQPETSILQC